MEPPGETERLPPLPEPEHHRQQVDHHQARGEEEPGGCHLPAPQTGSGEPGKHVVDATGQGDDQEAEHDGHVGHRLHAAVADWGEITEAQCEQRQELEHAGDCQEQGTYQEVGGGYPVLVGAGSE